ncbi:RPA1, partial [Symbiodinium necroappetens]
VAPKKPSACSRKYLQECDLRATVPDTLDFNTGFSSKLSAPHRGLTDHDLLSVTGMLPERQKVDEVCLKQNSGLTDASLVPFLRQFLKVPRLAEGLCSLNLKQCKGAGWQSLEVLRQLTFAARNLRELNLSGVQVGTHLQLKLCESLGVHRNLQFIGLSRSGLGGTCLTEDCLRHLLSSRSNRKLDLSWNVFSKKDFQVIGDYIAENTCLMHLLLDNTAAYIVGEDTPISELIEKLAFNSALRSLSICTNRIDSRAALVIEDSLEGHPMLSRLYLRNNPLGIHGLRSILRLLCRKESSMSRLDIEGCKSGDEKTKSTETHTKVFSFTNPGGKYILDLGIPYDRSLCRMLYETAERFNLEHNKAFVNINHSHPPYHHPVRDSIGQYKVRREGILTFTFNVESAIAAAWSNVADDDFIGFLNSHLAMMRFEPHKRKLRPLLANWKAISGMHAEQETFLTALASDFNMEVPYLEYMVQACPEASNEILFRLIPSLKRDGCSTFLAMSLFPRVEDLLETQWRMESFLLFNPQNPTGRYKLKLENSTDFAVAQQLLLLDRWESVVNRRHNRGDVSQRGNRSQLRNELYQGRALHLSVKLLTEWAMPEFGEFECDYATSYHPKQGSKPLSDTLWESVMMAIYDSPCRPEDQLKVLKIISHQIFLSSLHIRQMVGFFRKDEDREEALVMFWPRVIDKYNAKVFRVRFEKKEDVVRLQERLGYITFFPYFQPENAVFRFNMAVYEQRVSACLF